LIAARFREAKIPLTAVGFPHPGAVYYGANNYDAGLIAGRALARWARQRREGNVDGIVMPGRSIGASVPELRMQGMERGIPDILGEHRSRVVHVNGDGHFEGALRGDAKTPPLRPYRQDARGGNQRSERTGSAACVRRSRSDEWLCDRGPRRIGRCPRGTPACRSLLPERLGFFERRTRCSCASSKIHARVRRGTRSVLPPTSVSRKSRPRYRYVSFV
jgi:hypothetical protein